MGLGRGVAPPGGGRPPERAAAQPLPGFHRQPQRVIRRASDDTDGAVLDLEDQPLDGLASQRAACHSIARVERDL